MKFSAERARLVAAEQLGQAAAASPRRWRLSSARRGKGLGVDVRGKERVRRPLVSRVWRHLPGRGGGEQGVKRNSAFFAFSSCGSRLS
jgi:hypothetical protein